jgi:hypothetical protein
VFQCVVNRSLWANVNETSDRESEVNRKAIGVRVRHAQLNSSNLWLEALLSGSSALALRLSRSKFNLERKSTRDRTVKGVSQERSLLHGSVMLMTDAETQNHSCSNVCLQC